jgi:hypothetical protein
MQSLGRKCDDVRDTDVTTWSNSLVKITVNEVCSKFGIDIDNDRKNEFFWNVQLDKKVVVTEELLDWLRYSSEKYEAKKYAVTNLLKKNLYIEYYKIADGNNRRKKYYLRARCFGFRESSNANAYVESHRTLRMIISRD